MLKNRQLELKKVEGVGTRFENTLCENDLKQEVQKREKFPAVRFTELWGLNYFLAV